MRVIDTFFSSLVTTLRSAEKFEESHLSSPEVALLVENAKFYYVEGYFLSHGVDAALYLGSVSAAAGKVDFIFHQYQSATNLQNHPQTFVLNLSAPFIPQFFTTQLQNIIPYTDVIIGNESEAAAWASATGSPDVKDLALIARSIALLPKSNPSRPRIVIFTQGAHQTVMVTSDKPDNPKTFPVDPLADAQIVDTNGAGDAFAGGFLGARVAGETLNDSVLAGHALACACIQQVSFSIFYIPIKIIITILTGWTAIPMAKGRYPR
jgi:adenosine kinase